ncbi:OmpA family protein [Akkermansiaceae bacterium]|nr:OmpA family protein [Akkermansiaceae bacterium]MDB4288974.1 OmpA family protein [bacterium]MDB4261969.1 OmpA family protein [Akkermansiaceae bacterium]MDB4268064.1 OmpA family protein [Akkermansiaceae bacterium]MDB4317402.1 OmpA family protein [bacterium]
MKISAKVLISSLITALTLSSCQQTTNAYTGNSQPSKTTNGAVIGGLLGAGIGALTGDGGTDSRQRALIGAGIGALAGGGIGNYMDKQEAELRQELQGTGISITRQGNQVILNMPGDITFPTGESRISPDFFPTLNSVAKVVNKYNKTLVDVVGHTDNVGDRNYNYRLSQTRAGNVANYLQDRKVDSRRFNVSGRGPDEPAASNGSSSGRQLNRRVTIQLSPLRG